MATLPASEPDNLSSGPRTHKGEEKKRFPKLSPDLHTYHGTWMLTHVHMPNKKKKENNEC